MSNPVEKTILDAKDAAPEVTPTPDPQETPKSSAKALKDRLDWGEPALTIVDVRNRNAFNEERIMGAIAMPMEEELAERAKSSLQQRREIYVYGDDDEQTAQAASVLRQAGFESVSQLSGGVEAWKAVGGPIEGRDTKNSRLK
ncbi:MAG: rhodanese-like domain-containing protein [Cyanophyceae cyanobacterium]